MAAHLLGCALAAAQLAAAQDLFLAFSGRQADEPSSARADSETRSAGILYEVWHARAANLMRQVKEKGGEQLTVERVLRSNGAKKLDDVYGPYGLGGDIYNVEPAELGFYCLYTKRDGDTKPPIPDCEDVTGVARRHAELLVNAGFDYIAVDITNWPQFNEETDFAVLRPLEVLMDAWAELRGQGVPTPAVVAWPKAPVVSYDDGHQTTWQWLLDNIYNHATRSSLIWSRPGSGKKTFFVTDTSDRNPQADALIASNGGRHDVEVIGVWALFGKANYDQGSWGFFSPCTVPTGGYTTSMVGDATVLGDCEQYSSTGADGSVIEVSASGGYMLSQCSLPFAAPGHMRGLTLQRLFKKVLAQSPPNLFMSSFNEHIGGRQAPASGSAIAFNMGMPDDSQRSNVWVDTYAAEYSRDIEPTVEAGDRVYQVASSCVKLYKAGQTCDDAEAKDAPCCTTEDKEIWVNVWSLRRQDGSDRLLTTNSAERAELVAGGAWSEVCHAIVGPSVFCVDASMTDGRDGPFMLFSKSDAVPQVVPVYRCTIGSQHFFSQDPGCEGQAVESLLGYASAARGGETLRALRRCYIKASGVHQHALDLPCPGSTSEEAILGYVK